jgi:hypothetical protein
MAETVAQGAVFEGGQYVTLKSFDPVVTRVITEGIDLKQPEPVYQAAGWTPSLWDSLNSVRTPAGLQQQLIVIPAQYRSITGQTGVERRMKKMSYTIYYSTTQDLIPPNIWQVQSSLVAQDAVNVIVETTDLSGVVRVIVAYTTDDGVWQTVDLRKKRGQESLWQLPPGQALPNHPRLEYFVQAVDSGGNVAFQDNKGEYFGLNNKYFPIIFNNGVILKNN